MNYQEITPEKYAKWYGCSTQYIQKLLKDEQIEKLPFVIRVKKYSRFYVLEIPNGLTKDAFKEFKPKY